MKDIIFQLFALFGAGMAGYLVSKPFIPKFVKLLDKLRDRLWNKIYDEREQTKCSIKGKIGVDGTIIKSSSHASFLNRIWLAVYHRLKRGAT
jgi:hypothetical protein